VNILIVTTSYPDENEGAAAAGVFVRDFAQALCALGAEVSIIAPGIEDRHTDECGLHVHRFAVPRQPLSSLKPCKPQDWQAIWQTMRAGQNAVNQACTDRQIDSILALWALPSGAWAQQAAKRHKIPYDTWALGSDIWALGKLPLIRQWLRYVLRGAQQRYADGLQLGKDVEHISGMRCDFLPSARQLNALNIPPPRSKPPYRLAFLGRWHPNKGIDLLLASLNQLDADDWQRIEAVRIFGGGSLENQVHREILRMQHAGYPVEVGGYLNQSEATALLGWADYVLIPSRIESIPVIFSDAMQVGRPVITMPVGDLPALVERYTCGVCADEVSETGLTKAIRTALSTSPASCAEGIGVACTFFDIYASAQSFLEQREVA